MFCDAAGLPRLRECKTALVFSSVSHSRCHDENGMSRAAGWSAFKKFAGQNREESRMQAAAPQWSSQYSGTSFEGALPRLIEPEVLLPSQLYERNRHRSILEGERRLMLAVLEDAVSCFQKYAGATRPRNKRLFQESEE